MKKRLIIAACFCAAMLAVWWTAAPRPPIAWQAAIPMLRGVQPAVGPDGTVYANSTSSLLAYDRNGKQRWASPNSLWIDSIPLLGLDGTIYARARWNGPAATNGSFQNLAALEPNGVVKWLFPLDDILTNVATRPVVGNFGNRGIIGAALAADTHDTIYLAASPHLASPMTLFAVGRDGRERWRFDSAHNEAAPVEIAPNGSILFLSSDGKNSGRTSDLIRFDAAGKRLGAWNGYESWSFSMDWDGIVYLRGKAGSAMTALNPGGSLRWRFDRPLHAISVPTIGMDGSLYFLHTDRPGYGSLVALDKNGKLKWRIPMGHYWSLGPPPVASDGTLFFLTGPRLRALTPDGRVKWVFEPGRRSEQRLPRDWSDLKTLWNNYFGSQKLVISSLTLTPDGMLYLSIGDPYNTLYALRVGVGLATNSPWPMERGDARMTGRVAARAP